MVVFRVSIFSGISNLSVLEVEIESQRALPSVAYPGCMPARLSLKVLLLSMRHKLNEFSPLQHQNRNKD